MSYDPEKHHRRSIRLPEFDYSRAGAYFVTICVHERRCLFGEVLGGGMRPSPAGQMVQRVWDGLADACPNVVLDAFVAMPNHVHGIVWLTGVETAKAREGDVPLRFLDQHPTGTADGSLSRVLQRFKSVTTNEYIAGVKGERWPRFNGHVWQPNYFEHVIRDDEALAAIREYIITNPQRWSADKENPAGTGTDDMEAWLEELCRGEPRVRPDSRRGESCIRPVPAAKIRGRDEPCVRPDSVASVSSSAESDSGREEEGEHKARPYMGAERQPEEERAEGEHEVRPYKSQGRTQVSPLRIGHGYDLHRLQPGGKLMLAGIEVSQSLSPIAHSDGDVVIHALVDALLGALGWGDIGELFPNTDPQWKDAPSRVFIEHVYAKVRAEGYALVNADVTILAERPKLKAFKPAMRQFLESLLGGTINVKAGTNEGCDAIGRGEAIAAHAVVLLAKGE